MSQSRHARIAAPTTVIVTEVSSNKGPVVCRYLRALYPDLRIVTVDGRAMTRWFHTKFSDKHYVTGVGPRQQSAYVEKLVKIAEAEEADFIFPLNNKEMGILLAVRERFGCALDYWGEVETFHQLGDKSCLAPMLQASGIAHPRHHAGLEDAVLPVVVKPSQGVSAIGVHYVRNEGERAALLPKLDPTVPLVVQDYVEGEGAGYSVFARDGEILMGFGHKRLAEHPISGGSSVYRETCSDPRLKEIAARVLRQARWSGFAMVEFKLPEQGEPVLIEVNPRIWGSVHQGLACGINYFEPLLGPSQNQASFQPDLRTYFSPLLYLSLFRYAVQGQFGVAIDFFKNAWRNRSDVSLFADPAGFTSLLIRSWS